MTRELDEQLFNDFEFFRPERNMQRGLMCFGFECGDGWYDLIRNLSVELKKMLANIETDDGEGEFEVVQVKEKFGGLRFYTNWSTEEMYEKIEEAEGASYKICEECGQPGKTRTGGWIRTLCDYHAKKAGHDDKKLEEIAAEEDSKESDEEER